VVLVLHDINFASCYADHIIAMRDGKLAAQGTPQELIRPEVLRDLYQVEVKVHQIDGQRISVFYT
jgi:iron complex transport system ATP-binding protein